MVILLILSIICICLLINEIKCVGSEESPLLACCAIIIYIYAFGLVNLLNFAIYSLVAIGILAIPFVLIINRKNLAAYIKSLAQPGFLFFIFFLIALYPLCLPIVTGAWDEYSHWALIVRNMLLTGALPKAGGAIRFINYPPATAMIQYLFIKFTNGSEGMMYYGQVVFMAACFCTLIKGQKFKKPLYLVMAFVLPVIIVVKFSLHNIFNIFTDSIMPMLAAAGFAIYYSSNRKYKDILKLVPLIFVICLIRPNAVAFATFVILIVLVDQIKKKSDRDKKIHITLLTLLAPVALALGSWSLHLKIIGYVGKQSSILPIDWVHIGTVTHNFAVALCFKGVGNANPLLTKFTTALSMCVMGGILMLILYYVLRKEKALRKEFTGMCAMFIVGFILYCAGMLGAYVFSFTKTEGVQVAAYNRYLGSYFMFAVACIGYMMISMLTKDKVQKLIKVTTAVLSALIILAMAGLSQPGLLNIFGSRQLENVYEEESKACAQQIQKAIGMDAKVYMIFQKSRGYTFMGTRYQLGTNPTNLGSWSFGTPYSDQDTWTVDWTPETLATVLIDQGYEYVYIGRGDEQLWNSYGQLFDKPDQGYIIYKVNLGSNPLLTAMK